MMVYSALTTFCPNLSNDSTPKISDFIQQDGITGNDVFVWNEIQYRHPEHHIYVNILGFPKYKNRKD